MPLSTQMRIGLALAASLSLSLAVSPAVAGSGTKYNSAPKTPSYQPKPKKTAKKKAPVCQGEVSYKVTFTTDWTDGSHYGAIPANPHFSPMVVATHARGSSVYSTGGTASAGMKLMAETGKTSDLETDLAALGSKLGDWAKGSRINAPGSGSVTVTASAKHPMLTMVSMIAPSPDWFVGVSGLRLCKNGKWKDSIDWPLKALDAGTDSGGDFTSANQATSPYETIHWLGADLKKSAKGAAQFGMLKIEKI